ncbi:MAG: endonuclease/exonuclease/phosphatase family protein [Candidatus Paceibacterota bacterium]|jgi:endonuclease/exonuclease/phosphatase family metal-dependent hydrolase
MKLINLNLQGGVVYEPMMEFIKNHSLSTDIFSFQEVFHDAKKTRPLLGNVQPKLFSELQNILPDFNGYYAAPVEIDVGGLVIFIKKDWVVKKTENLILFPELNNTEDENDDSYFSMGRNLQIVEFSFSGKTYKIFNFHGMWIARGKADTEKRILQSEKVKKIFDESKGARILCADLNVSPDTQSLAILKDGNRNLVEEYGIITTRSSLKNRSEVVDYIIVSPEVEVKNFEVLTDEVSDHLPLLLEFE